MVAVDPNMLAPFLQKGARPELQPMAPKALKGAGFAPKQKMQIQRS